MSAFFFFFLLNYIHDLIKAFSATLLLYTNLPLPQTHKHTWYLCTEED